MLYSFPPKRYPVCYYDEDFTYRSEESARAPTTTATSIPISMSNQEFQGALRGERSMKNNAGANIAR